MIINALVIIVDNIQWKVLTTDGRTNHSHQTAQTRHRQDDHSVVREQLCVQHVSESLQHNSTKSICAGRLQVTATMPQRIRGVARVLTSSFVIRIPNVCAQTNHSGRQDDHSYVLHAMVICESRIGKPEYFLSVRMCRNTQPCMLRPARDAD